MLVVKTAVVRNVVALVVLSLLLFGVSVLAQDELVPTGSLDDIDGLTVSLESGFMLYEGDDPIAIDILNNLVWEIVDGELAEHPTANLFPEDTADAPYIGLIVQGSGYTRLIIDPPDPDDEDAFNGFTGLGDPSYSFILADYALPDSSHDIFIAGFVEDLPVMMINETSGEVILHIAPAALRQIAGMSDQVGILAGTEGGPVAAFGDYAVNEIKVYDPETGVILDAEQFLPNIGESRMNSLILLELKDFADEIEQALADEAEAQGLSTDEE